MRGSSPFVAASLAALLFSPVFSMAEGFETTVLVEFGDESGYWPRSELVVPPAGDTLFGTTAAGGDSLKFIENGIGMGHGTIFAYDVSQNKLTSIFHFNGTNGSGPQCLSYSVDGYLYGTTEAGGLNNGGTLFRISTTGKLTTLVHFGSPFYRGWPSGPAPGLVLDSFGNYIYGATSGGGSNGLGTVFMVKRGTEPFGDLTNLVTLVHFDGTNGSFPASGPVGDIIGNLFGTTSSGGIFTNSNAPQGHGTVYRLTPSTQLAASDGGKMDLTTLVHFNGANGSSPLGRLLLRGVSLYGTTQQGGKHTNNYGSLSNGAAGHGTVFVCGTLGSFQTIFHFNGTNGRSPMGSLQELPPGLGILAGTTRLGGTNTQMSFYGNINDDGNGTVFAILTGLRTLHHFDPANGSEPWSPTVSFAGNRVLYGVTSLGGRNGRGTLYKLTPKAAPRPSPGPDRARPTVKITSPATLRGSSYTLAAKLADNVRPVRVQYRLRAPGAKGFGKWVSVNLRSKASAQNWSQPRIALNKRGVWLMQVQVFDAAKNSSLVPTLRVNRTR